MHRLIGYYIAFSLFFTPFLWLAENNMIAIGYKSETSVYLDHIGQELIKDESQETFKTWEGLILHNDKQLKDWAARRGRFVGFFTFLNLLTTFMLICQRISANRKIKKLERELRALVDAPA